MIKKILTLQPNKHKSTVKIKPVEVLQIKTQKKAKQPKSRVDEIMQEMGI